MADDDASAGAWAPPQPDDSVEDADRPRTSDLLRDAVERGRARRRRALAVAVTVLVVAVGAMVIGVAWFVLSSDEQSVVDDEPMRATAADPTWFGVIAASVPDGFDYTAIAVSNHEYVAWSIFDVDVPRALLVTVSRGPRGTSADVVTLAEVQRSTWTDPSIRREVLLPDQRLVIVDCGLVAIHLEPGTCPAVAGVETDPEELRQFVIALATDLSVDDLPERDDAPPAVPIDDLRAVADRFVDMDPAGAGDSDPASGGAVVELGTFTNAVVPAMTEAFTIRAYTGLYPTVDGAFERREVEIDRIPTSWQLFDDGSLWSVTWSPGLGDDLGGRVLDHVADTVAAG